MALDTDWEAHARFLWDLLDDIDTTGDMAKADDQAYRARVERIQRRRFEISSSDGYTVTFLAASGVPSGSREPTNGNAE